MQNIPPDKIRLFPPGTDVRRYHLDVVSESDMPQLSSVAPQAEASLLPAGPVSVPGAESFLLTLCLVLAAGGAGLALVYLLDACLAMRGYLSLVIVVVALAAWQVRRANPAPDVPALRWAIYALVVLDVGLCLVTAWVVSWSMYCGGGGA
jgi:hypothetical protein